MRILKTALLALPTLAALLLAVANRAPVRLHFWPEGLPAPAALAGLPLSAEIPLYVALLAALFVGVSAGLALEMLRETRHRREARRLRRETRRLAEENRALRLRLGEDPDDDLLGLPAPSA